MSDRVKVHHIRKSGHCVHGIREVCERYGFDVRRLVKDGIPIHEIEHIDDENVKQVIELAREED